MHFERIDINAYATKLMSDRIFKKMEYKKFVSNCYILQDIGGNIKPDILNAVICKAKWDRRLRIMLTGILWYVDTESISDKNFRMLLCFPHNERCTYLAAISHAEIAFYQMQMINRISSSFESFVWLFERICVNDFFKEEDMLQLLRDTSDVTSYGILTCIRSVREKYGDLSKLAIAENWAKNMTK